MGSARGASKPGTRDKNQVPNSSSSLHLPSVMVTGSVWEKPLRRSTGDLTVCWVPVRLTCQLALPPMRVPPRSSHFCLVPNDSLARVPSTQPGGAPGHLPLLPKPPPPYPKGLHQAHPPQDSHCCSALIPGTSVCSVPAYSGFHL